MIARAPILLIDFVDSLAASRGWSVLSLATRKIAIASLNRHLGRAPTVEDLSKPTIGDWTVAISTTVSTSTLATYLEGVRTIWIAAYREGLTANSPGFRKQGWTPRGKKERPKKDRFPLAVWRRPDAGLEKPSPDVAGTTLADYYLAVYVPAKLAQNVGAKSIEDVGRAIKWLQFSLKRVPMLADLSDGLLCELQSLIVKEGRTTGTARGIVERLLILWRFAVWRGDMSSGDSLPPSRVARPHVATLKANRPPKKKRQSTIDDRDPPMKIPTLESRRDDRPAEAPAPRYFRKATKKTKLSEFVSKHYASSHDLKPNTLQHYMTIVAKYSRYLGRPTVVGDLNADAINGFLANVLQTLARQTARGHRTALIVLWRYCYESKVLDEFPRRVRPVKCGRQIIEGLDVKQMATLIEAASKLLGKWRKTSIERRLWWRAFLLVAWYSGLRLADLLAIRRESITTQSDGSGRLSLIMEKTGAEIHRALPPDAMLAIEELAASGSPRQLCFPLWAGRRFYFREFKALAASAGLPTATTKFIRRGSSSELERLHAGAGRLHLGHRSGPELFERNYRVARICESDIKLPPTIGRKDGAA